MAERNYYCICEDNCRFPTMTKEQILTAITQAVESGVIKDVDTGFVQTIKTINGKSLKFFVGTQAEYEALTADEKNGLFAVITNDTTKESLLQAIEKIINGETPVAEATHAGEAETASADSFGNSFFCYGMLSTTPTLNTPESFTVTGCKVDYPVGSLEIFCDDNYKLSGATYAKTIDFVLCATANLPDIVTETNKREIRVGCLTYNTAGTEAIEGTGLYYTEVLGTWSVVRYIGLNGSNNKPLYLVHRIA